ncbi:MAG: hypothetical protein KDE51_27385, partial [Anaerolineales bacterium]|nr:hypothetical protein [Anaerolineales bacterium]
MPDVGDAPDSTNASGTEMSAYPGVVAKFPTVFGSVDSGLPQGPKHLNPELQFYLGSSISGEDDADAGADSDGIFNLIPAADKANNDGFDDGLGLPGQLEHCARIKVRYIVTLEAPFSFANPYVNLWFDWNRDGSWQEQAATKCSDGQQIPEWAVQNAQINLIGPNTYVLETPYFRVYNPTPERDMWVRITVSEQPAPAAPIEAGQGPNGGYGFGETEDYLIPGQVDAPGVDIFTSDNKRFHANVVFPEHKIDSFKEVDGQTYTALLLPAINAAREAARRNNSSSSSQTGKPLLPAINQILAIPAESTTPTLKIGQISYGSYMTDVIIYPAQPSPIDQDLPDDNADFGDPPFTINKKAYLQDQSYPQEIATLTSLGTYRGLQLMLLSVASGEYNPVDKLFRPYRS